MMTPELTALALAGLLQVAQLAIYVIAGDRQVGLKKALGPRDDHPQLTGKPARLQRAYNNHIESLILFTIAVAVVTLSDQSTQMTRSCAWVYLAARVLYVPAYAFGLAPWRSVIWTIGIAAATLMMIVALI
jgi:uncharacterized MAPEG superfamily protein